MATDLERLVVQLSADIRGYERSLNRANGITNQRARQIEQRYEKLSSSINRSFQGVLASTTALIGVQAVTRYADAWTTARNSIAIAGATGEQTGAILDKLYDSAQRNAAPIGALAGLYGRAAQASDNLGASTSDLISFTDGIAVALRVGGTNAQAASGALTQLGQALGSTRVFAEEFNSINEGARPILLAVAAGSEKAAGSVSKLRTMVINGEISGREFFEAFQKGRPILDEMAKRAVPTLSQGFVRLDNALTRFVGNVDQTLGASAALTGGLTFLSNNLESIAVAAATAGSLILSSYVPALARVAVAQAAVIATNPFLLLVTAISGAAYALSAFGAEIQPIQGDMANLQDYAAGAWGAIGEGASIAATTISGALLSAINLITDAVSGIEVSWADVYSFIAEVVNRLIGSFVHLYDQIVTTFTKLPQAIAESTINAMNKMVEYIENSINRVIQDVNKLATSINDITGVVGIGAIGGIDEVSLGRLENSFAGAGASAGDAYVENFRKALKGNDYIGDVGEDLRRRANINASDRQQRAKDKDFLDQNVANIPASDDAKGKKARKEKLDDYQKEVQRIRERTDALTTETEVQRGLNPLVNDYGYAVEFAAAQQRLTNAAIEAGREVTPALAEEIRILASEYANSGVAAEKLAESQDKVKQRQAEILELQKDVTRGLVDDLLEGKDAAEVFNNALKKIASTLLDSAFQQFFNPTSSGGIGGFGGFFSALFKGFADGGYTGAGGMYEPAGVVHKGEYVVPKNVVDKVGVGNLERLFRNGYANGGLVGGASRPAPSFGQSSTGLSLNYSPQIDARGASVEAVARLERAIQNDRDQLGARVIATVQKARASNVKGV